MNSDPIRTSPRTGLRLVLRALLVLWAGFWAWFVLAVSFGGREAPPPWWIPAAWLSALALFLVLCWKKPALGGIALVSAALWAASFFDNAWARGLLAAPAFLLGAGFLALRWRYSIAPGKRAL